MIEQINQQNIGQQYDLKLSIHGIQVPTSNVLSSVLREWIFDRIVTLECMIMDTGTFVELSPIYDESPVLIEFSKNNEPDKIQMEFRINATEVERTMADNGGVYIIKFVALQKTNDYFYPIKTKSYKNQTTSDVFLEIANNAGVKFIKEIDAKDNQIWVQSNACDYSFGHHLIKRSFVNSEDRPLFYFNRRNEAVFSSIKTKCSTKSKFIAINNDYAFLDNGNDNVIKELKQTLGNDVKILYYKTDITYKDISSIFNKKNGYGINFTYFDLKNFFEYQLSFSFSPLTKYSKQNKNNSKKFVNGLTYNTLSKNCHENYLLAKTQNLMIDQMFFGSYLQMSINPELSLNLGDKISVIVYDNLSRMKNGPVMIDKVNSGEYIVGGISHDIKKDSLYTMNLTLFRGGINSSDITGIETPLLEGNSK
jgi:hypothetical protein